MVAEFCQKTFDQSTAVPESLILFDKAIRQAVTLRRKLK